MDRVGRSRALAIAAPWFIAVLLAGCGTPQADAAPASEAEAVADELDLAATPTTGLLLGVVVDERVVPVEGARVSLAPGGRQANTTTSGTFGFDGLEPGTYLITVRKAGFLDATFEAASRAGEADPPLFTLQLHADGGYLAPFSEASKVEGYIECTGNPMAICSIPNNYRPTACSVHELACYDNVTSDNARVRLEMVGNTSFLQAELVWQASSGFTEQLGWKAEHGVGCDGVGGDNHLTYGPSPLLAPPIEPLLRVPGGDPCSVIINVSAGGLVDGACVPDAPLFGTVCPGVAFQQQFAAFVHAFYGYLPPAGWRFTSDGAPPEP